MNMHWLVSGHVSLVAASAVDEWVSVLDENDVLDGRSDQQRPAHLGGRLDADEGAGPVRQGRTVRRVGPGAERERAARCGGGAAERIGQRPVLPLQQLYDGEVRGREH